jgi:hypothetical protein
MDSSPPNENRRQSAPSPDISDLSSQTLVVASGIVLAVATVASHGLLLPILIGVGSSMGAAGTGIKWFPVISKLMQRKDDKR